ncbi:MAG: hypothetical protein GFH27_549287n279 [Chloroflexi bacterium AL-W]|nr:hypothetical protein [Chloroflexi bacterium AL-N1]NOK66553.1 hypothetical protein [Chloroflexi bacterium AL-N10]NOK71941.1 hypothetical protein [Chloroflexi bacterium AL-N5]NOK81198.1 hypothetical protein [Chloroflexi bacterium AL-W]NOK89471.1 hypothetical protein [Chloroflexi bacterium AL-N15]
MHTIWQDISDQQLRYMQIIATLTDEQEAHSTPPGEAIVPQFVRRWVLYGVVAGHATPLYE